MADGAPDPDHGQQFMDLREVPKRFNLPVVELAITPDIEKEHGVPLATDELLEEAEFGSVVTYDGSQYVVIEHNSDYGALYLVPATCIDLEA